MVGLELGGLDGIGGLDVVDRLLCRRLFGSYVSFQDQHLRMLEAAIDGQGKAKRAWDKPTPIPESKTPH
jgi:hypothetical protein